MGNKEGESTMIYTVYGSIAQLVEADNPEEAVRIASEMFFQMGLNLKMYTFDEGNTAYGKNDKWNNKIKIDI